MVATSQLVPVLALFQPTAKVFFRPALGLGPHRTGVEFRGIDEVDAMVHGIVKLPAGFLPCVLLAPGHAAQTDHADIDIGMSQFPVLHVSG